MPEKIDISVGVCAYNEEHNIKYLLESLRKQKTSRVNIQEIIVVSDGSTDKTDDIVKEFSWNGILKLARLDERRGKYAAINEFLKLAKSGVLALVSGDVILDEDAIEKLCSPFLSEENLGMTGGRPIPKNPMHGLIGYTVNLQWYLHHRLSLIQPKFGEIIAFRNIIKEIPPTLVDEEQIAFIIKTNNYKLKYIPEAACYNKGPENIRDFIVQRRRIYAGHLLLKKDYNYEVITFKGRRILKILLKDLSGEFIKNIYWLFLALLLESVARMLARFDVFFKKGCYNYKWKIARSTKNLKY